MVNKKSTQPSKSLVIITLIITVTFNFGNYFIQDIPQLTSKGFLNYFNKTPEDVEYLYSLYSLGATPMAILGGVLVAKYTSTRVCLISTFGIFFSTIITYYAIYSKKYIFVIIGRLLFGFSGEPAQIAELTLISEIFTEKYLSFATGMYYVIGNLGYAGSYYFNPKMYVNSRGISLPFFVGGICSALSSMTAALWGYIDIFKGDILRNKLGEERVEEEFNLKFLKDIKKPEVVLGIINVILGSQGYLTYATFSTGVLTTRFNYPLLKAKNIIFTIPLLTIISIPIYSSIATKFGKKMIILGIGYLLLIAAYLIMIFHRNEQSYFINFSYFLLSQYWSITCSCFVSSLALVTKTRALGLAFGLSLFGNNFVAIFVTMFFGYLIKDATPQGYQKAIIGMIFIAVLGFLFVVVTFVVDMKGNRVLYIGEKCEEMKGIRRRIDFGKDDDDEESTNFDGEEETGLFETEKNRK